MGNNIIKTRIFHKLKSKTFIYESILMRIHMNANIMKTQLFHQFLSMTSQGHLRSYLVTFLFKGNFFSDFLGCNLISSKLYINNNIMNSQIFHQMKYDLKCNFYVMEKFSDIFLQPWITILRTTFVFVYLFSLDFDTSSVLCY